MANLRKKVINKWDDGILTSPRTSDQTTANGAQMVRGFDIYKDPKKLVPMQSWEAFTTVAERAYGIRALGGQSDTIYGLGNALKNWYGSAWNYRIRVDITPQYHLANGLPLYVDLSTLGSDFWNNVSDGGVDIRVASSSDASYPCFVENFDLATETGDLWVDGEIVATGSPSFFTEYEQTGTGTFLSIENDPYAVAFPITLLGHTLNHLTFKAYREGNPGIMYVDLYSDTAGTPNALVTNLGSFDANKSLGKGVLGLKEIKMAFDSISLTGNYHLVFRCPTAVNSTDYIEIEYGTTGSLSIKKADNIGLSSWSEEDASATPNYKLQYFENTTTAEKYFYIYYGNATATVPEYGFGAFSYTDGGREVFRNNSMRFAYTFGNEDTGNRYYNNSTTGGLEAFTTDPHTFADALFGKGIKTYSATIATDSDDDVGLTGNDISVSMLLYATANVATTLFSDEANTISVQLTASGKINFHVNATGGTTDNTTTDSIALNQWHVIDCVFNDDAYIWVDGVLQTFDVTDGDFDGQSVDNTVKVNTGEIATLAQLWAWNDDLSSDQVATKFNNFTKSDFFSIGSQVAFTSINPVYDGVQLYYKLISSGDWVEYIEGGRPVKSMSVYPVNGFIDDSGTYFVVSQSAENQGFLLVAERDIFTVINTSYLTLTAIANNTSKIVIQSEVAIDNVEYSNKGNSTLVSINPDDASVFGAQATIQSLSAWRTYLAIGSNTRNKGYVDIWDLADTLATDKATTGTGNLRIVGNAGDILFAVTDNFIDDAVKSSNKPSMEIWQYAGNGEMDRTHYIEVPAVIDDSTYTDNWERAVSNFKIQRNKQTLFYARIPNVADGSTFDEGFWAVGKNTDGRLALTLQISTADLGMPENVFGFAQQVFFVQKDGGIVRLSDDTYSDVSLYKTLKMNEGNTEVEKKLVGVEIITEPLESGQTVSVYYKQNGDSERTKIFDMTGEDEIVYETTYDINENNLPHYKEIEFDIESTGGKSGILEFNYKYEYLSDII